MPTIRIKYDAALAATQWRSMDSAPRDGTLVYLAWKDDEDDAWCRCSGRWEYGEWRDTSSCEECDRYFGRMIPATHWMPLPEPPKEGE